MAKKVTFEILTKAQTAELARLQGLLESLTKTGKKLGKTEGFNELSSQLKGLNKEVIATSKLLGKDAKKYGSAYKEQAKDVETLQTRLRDLGSTVSKVDSIRKRSKDLDLQIAAAVEKETAARTKAKAAQVELNRVRNKKDATVAEIDNAVNMYGEAKKAAEGYGKELDGLHGKYRKMGREILVAEGQVEQLERTMAEATRLMDKKSLGKLFTKADAQNLMTARDSLNSLGAVMEKTFNGPQSMMGRNAGGFNFLTANIKRMGDASIPVLQDMRKEILAMSKLDAKNLATNLGGGEKAVSGSFAAIRKQSEEAQRLRGEMSRLDVASDRWIAAELESRRVVDSGTNALKERTRVAKMYTTAMSTARSAETTLAKDQTRLLNQQKELQAEMARVRSKGDFAQSNLASQKMGTASYREAEQGLERWRQAYSRLDAAMDANTNNIRQNQAAMNAAQNQVAQIERSQQSWGSTMTALSSSMSSSNNARQLFAGMIAQIRTVNQHAMALAATFGGRLRSAISGIASAAKSGLGSVGTIFAGLQRSLQSAGNGVTSFANKFTASMDRSRASMMELYAAGFSLMMLGQQTMQFGTQMFRSMGQSLDQYMSYEKMSIQAAIAGASPNEGGGYTIDKGIIDSLVFDLQRGMSVPWLNSGQALPVTFKAEELAQGLYYYSSAIGVPITDGPDGNRDMVGATVATIMQAAKVTNTSLESAIKGVMNVAMEYGMDPRDLSRGNSEDISKVAAQMAYLSNISTMEMTDIVETFKMLGPMAHVLSGSEAGSGLSESFLLTFLASEVGLRGGNVGRGINQLLTGILDPSAKTLEKTGKYFGEQYSTLEGFQELFMDGQYLKGGLRGFFETLSSAGEEVQTEMLASMFTTNATRSGIGVIEGFNGGTIGNGQTLDEWLAEIEGDSPFEWLGQAAAETANSVSGWFAFMSNAWFQFQASIIGSVSGPLMGAFRLIGETLFEIAERINLNPAIGQGIAGIITAIAGIATVVGVLMAAAGAVLLIGRMFAMVGGFVLPLIRFFSIAAVTGLALVPIFLAIAVAVGLLMAAFQANLFGIQDGWNAITNAFQNFDATILPIIDRIIDGIGILGQAFDEFINGILLGDMSTQMNNLFGMLQRVFGPMLGASMIDGLLRMRDALSSTRDMFTGFTGGIKIGMDDLRDAGLAIQGFLEILFLGTARPAAFAAMGRLGDLFGIDDFVAKIAIAADRVRAFVNVSIGYLMQLASAWVGMSQQIWANMGRIFSGGLGGAINAVAQLIAGIATGIAASFTVVFGVISYVVDKIADFADGLRKAQGEGRTFMGMAMSLNNILRLIGVTIGAFLGARLLLMFSPLAGILVRILPLVLALSGGIIGLGGRFLVMAAQIAVSTVAFLAQVAVMGLVIAAKLAFAAAEAVLAFAQGATTTAAGAQTGVMGVLAFAYGVVTGSATIASGAMGMFAAVLSVVVAVVTVVIAVILILIGTLLAIAIGVSIFAGMMLLVVGLTQGWGAALQGLAGFLLGVWAGLQFGIAIIMMFVDAASQMLEWIGQITGIGNAFAVLGVIVGAALSGIILIIAVLTVMFVSLATTAIVAAGLIAAAFLMLSAPILVPLIAIGILIAALLGFDGPLNVVKGIFESVFNGIASFLENVFRGIELTFATMIDGITGGLAAALNNISGWSASIPSELMPEGLDDWMDSVRDIQGTNMVADIRAQQQQGAGRPSDPLGIMRDPYYANMRGMQQGVDINVKVKDSALMSFLDSIGVGGQARELMIKVGIDPDTFSMGDLSSDKLADFLKLPEASDFNQTLEDYELTPFIDQYQKDLRQWEMMNKTFGDNPLLNALPSWVPNPLGDRPDMVDYIDMGSTELGGEFDTSQWEADFQAAVESTTAYFENMTIQQAMEFQFEVKGGMGEGANSVAGFLGEFGDTIVQNVGDAAPWFNLPELFLDAAIAGELDTDLAGQNIHEALRPALEVVVAQTGIAYEDLIAGIPKWTFDENLFNFATAEFVKGFQDLPQTTKEQLDLVGMEQGWTEFGLDVTDIIEFGTSNAMKGKDWNLATYFAESYGLEWEEVNRVLREYGIDPDIINQDNFAGTEQLAQSLRTGATILTEEMYAMAQNFVAASDGAAIIMTSSELANVPDAVLGYLTDLGYVFVVDDTASDVTTWAEGVKAAMDYAFGIVTGTPLVGPDGKAAPTGNRTDMGWMDESEGWYPNQPTTGGTKAPTNTPAAYTPPPLTNEQAWVTEYTKGQKAGEQALTTAMATPINIPSPAITIDMSGLESSLRQQASAAAQAFGQSFKSAMAMAMSTATVSAPTAGYMSGNGGGMGTTTSGSGIKIDVDTTAAMTKITDLQAKIATLGGADAASTSLKIDLDTSGAAAKIEEILIKVRGLSQGSWPINIQINFDPAGVEMLNQFEANMDSYAASSPNITVNISTVGEERITELKTSLSYLSTGQWPITVTANTSTPMSNVGLLKGALQELVTTWTATVIAITSGASSAIEGVLQKLRYLTTGSWNATVGVNDNASSVLSSISNQLSNLNGRVATSTVNVVTNATTVTRTIAGNTATAAVGGWRQGGQSVLVGERGPEMVYFPDDGYVFTAQETAALNRQSASSASSNPFAKMGAADTRSVSSGSNNGGNSGGNTTLHFHGDFHFANERASKAFFEEAERHTGKQTELAKRGMRSVGEVRTW